MIMPQSTFPLQTIFCCVGVNKNGRNLENENVSFFQKYRKEQCVQSLAILNRDFRVTNGQWLSYKAEQTLSKKVKKGEIIWHEDNIW